MDSMVGGRRGALTTFCSHLITGGHRGDTPQSLTKPPWNLTVQQGPSVRAQVCVNVKAAPSTLRGLSWWDGSDLACGERTAGATPSAALLFLHRLTLDCLYVLHDKDI